MQWWIELTIFYNRARTVCTSIIDSIVQILVLSGLQCFRYLFLGEPDLSLLVWWTNFLVLLAHLRILYALCDDDDEKFAQNACSSCIMDFVCALVLISCWKKLTCGKRENCYNSFNRIEPNQFFHQTLVVVKFYAAAM